MSRAGARRGSAAFMGSLEKAPSSHNHTRWKALSLFRWEGTTQTPLLHSPRPEYSAWCDEGLSGLSFRIVITVYRACTQGECCPISGAFRLRRRKLSLARALSLHSHHQ